VDGSPLSILKAAYNLGWILSILKSQLGIRMTVQIRLIILTEKFKDTKMTLEFANAKMQENLEKLLKNNETYKKLDSAKEAVSHHKSFAKHLLNKGWKKLVSHKVAGHEGEIFVHPDSRHVITLIRHKNASKGHVERNQKHVYMSRQFAINHVSEAAGHIGIRPAYYNTHYATFKTTDAAKNARHSAIEHLKSQGWKINPGGNMVHPKAKYHSVSVLNKNKSVLLRVKERNSK
jgi:hypothetical protein